ncbi:MAG TPA: gamma-glutamyltransferase [Acidimicrobiales bacterium]|nr:gamma-glutamyltransferase [Acidimicrobiales bacterium]
MAEQCTGRGAHGVVCAAAPLAASAGAQVLREGGNAYDAVVAMALAEGVLLPPKCGLGGDLVAIALAGGSDDAVPESLLAIGGAAAGLAGAASSHPWRDVGATSVGPPAAPAGYLVLASRGRLPLERLAAPALALATDGFPWAGVATDLSRQSVALLQEMQPDGCTYLVDGRPIERGTIVRLPRLAAAIGELLDRGPEVLAGPLGAAVVRAVRARGGVLMQDDLLAHARAEWVPCASGTAGPFAAWATPAPTQGPALLHAVAGARPAAGAGDAYGRVMAAVDVVRQSTSDPSGTSMVSAADRDGNVVVVVHSNSYPRFGSGIVVPEYDLVLNNRAGRGFTPEPDHPNFPAAGRRPATTLHAWMVADATGRPRLAGGTPGGDNQMPWNAQTLGQVVSGCWSPGVLVASPKWEWLPADDGVRVEGGLGDDDVVGLAAVAPRVVRGARWGLKSAQQVVRVRRGDEPYEAAADPRTVGSSLGV